MNSKILKQVTAYYEATLKEKMLPQEIQLGMAGLEVFKASFLQKPLPRPQSGFLGLAEVFPA